MPRTEQLHIVESVGFGFEHDHNNIHYTYPGIGSLPPRFALSYLVGPGLDAGDTVIMPICVRTNTQHGVSYKAY